MAQDGTDRFPHGAVSRASCPVRPVRQGGASRESPPPGTKEQEERGPMQKRAVLKPAHAERLRGQTPSSRAESKSNLFLRWKARGQRTRAFGDLPPLRHPERAAGPSTRLTANAPGGDFLRQAFLTLAADRASQPGRSFQPGGLIDGGRPFDGAPADRKEGPASSIGQCSKLPATRHPFARSSAG